MNLLQGMRPWAPGPTPEALRIVRAVFESASGPLKTKDIYKLAGQQAHEAVVPPPTTPGTVKKIAGGRRLTTPLPPRPTHPVRSLSYLKQTLLPALVTQNVIEKFHTKSTLSEDEIKRRLSQLTKAARKAKSAQLHGQIDTWLWKLKPPQSVPTTPTADKEKPVFGHEIGVGADWSHLNKRRLRAREEKIGRDLKWLKMLKRAQYVMTKEEEAAKAALEVEQSVERKRLRRERRAERAKETATQANA